MWHIVTYQPVSLISLKLATATSTGGKSLLLPTPFALKMALLNVVIQDQGLAVGQSLWESIRNGRFAINGPLTIAVTNTFTKILKPLKGKPALDEETGLTRPFINSIGFREYVSWQGEFQLAFQPGNVPEGDWQRWLTMINYIGKRGGFVQAIASGENKGELDDVFIKIDEESSSFLLKGTLQLMDDCASTLSFEQVDIYSGKNMRTGKDRILRQVVIPYQMQSTSRAYTLYHRIP